MGYDSFRQWKGSNKNGYFGKESYKIKKITLKMKASVLAMLLTLVSMHIQSQSYNSDRVSFTNFLIRMYNNAPFEGVRAVNDYDDAFLISVLALDKKKY